MGCKPRRENVVGVLLVVPERVDVSMANY